eukprot:Tamp_20231.p2 GENE.Tamp_20231~~Tamp_20231.p2  ORF type:complete len:158 (+),score=40.16 Tamp_20231:504-977(+)
MRATATAGLLAAACATMSGASAFAPSSLALRGPAAASSCRPAACGLSILSMGKRPLHTSGEFTVEKATPELMEDLEVKRWPTWSTKGSEKYKVGVKSPLKIYDCNELSYIISGKMEIECKKTGKMHLVQAGDFVTFPDEFPCFWHVKEEITKHYYLY